MSTVDLSEETSERLRVLQSMIDERKDDDLLLVSKHFNASKPLIKQESETTESQFTHINSLITLTAIPSILQSARSCGTLVAGNRGRC